jgi:hypothetical protein
MKISGQSIPAARLDADIDALRTTEYCIDSCSPRRFHELRLVILHFCNDEDSHMSCFRSDCSQCCGLCCVVPAYFAFQGFGTDKSAHTPCTQLDCRNRCVIHNTREDHGYTACAAFDCYGAGQWVTQQLGRNANWRDSPAMAASLFDAYTQCLPLFELAAMLDAAMPLLDRSLSTDLLANKRDEIIARCASHVARQTRTDIGRLRSEVQELLADIRTSRQPQAKE